MASADWFPKSNAVRGNGRLRRVALLGDAALYEAGLDRLFAAYFQRGEDIGDAETLRRLAVEVGVPLERLPDATPADARPASVEAAVAGVPYFTFNESLSLSGAHEAAIPVMGVSQPPPAQLNSTSCRAISPS